MFYAPVIDYFALCNLTLTAYKTQKKIETKKQQKHMHPKGGSWVLSCFYFFLFLVSWFLGCWFPGFLVRCLLFLKDWQNNTKVAGPNSLPLLPPWGVQTRFGFLKKVCFGSVVPLENHVKTMDTCRYHWGKLRGLGHGLGNFVAWISFTMCQTTMRKHRQSLNL